MNIISVIPLVRSKVADTLSYFTASDVPLGAVVSVPLRSKSIHAIVTEKRPVEDLKAEIRQAPYEIRKLGKVKAGAFFSPAFIDACRTLADFYATTVGNVIGSLVPEIILENAHKIAPPLAPQASFIQTNPALDESYAVQGDDPDRVSTWRSLIRQEFARKKSLIVYVPTIEDVRQMFGSLEKGIEGYIFMLHSGLPKKKFLDTWTEIAEEKHPVVIITTPGCAILPRGDIDTVVIERENGRGWITQRAPYLDLRHALEVIARAERRIVHIADALLRIETLERLDDAVAGGLAKGTPFKWRSISTAADMLVDMRRPPGRKMTKAEITDADLDDKPAFRVLSPELEDLVRRNHEENTHLFILTARRGMSPITVCDDCETLVACLECKSPVVLHSKEGGKNFYMCHKCGARRSTDTVCDNCGGARLSPLGIGADRVREEVEKLMPDIEVFRIDADATATEKQILETLERWRDRPGSVLVGTETALTHLSEPVDHTAVASIDSWLSLPDFRMQERIMYALIRLRGLSSRTFLVQTRRPEEKVFDYGVKGNLSDFYHTIVSERKQFDYPPFSTLIKITLSGKKERIAKEMGELQAHVLPHEIDVFPAFTSSVRGTSVIHGLIRIPVRQWPDQELMGKLRAMPPDVSVKVNPETLL